MSLVPDGEIPPPLTDADVVRTVEAGLKRTRWRDKRVLVIVPDGTRTAPIPLFYRVLYELLGRHAKRLDYLIALGTHQPMTNAAIDRLVGVKEQERLRRFPNVRVFNHAWYLPETLTPIGTISGSEMAALTGELVDRETVVTINRAILDYDALIIVGPVLPHEVAGFSGGAKYLFPGVSGREIIDSTHWTGALATSRDTIGIKDTPVRRVIHRAAEFVTALMPVTCIALVPRGNVLHGVFIGDHVSAWKQAANLSGRLNIVRARHPFRKVLSMASRRYEDLWTGAKAMYKTEPVVADEGEIIIYAPHITRLSNSHDADIRRVGYHVRDYFLKQWARFEDTAWTVLAHSTHVKGAGTFDRGIERARIRVTLATGIAEAECHRVNLGYRDPDKIDPADWAGREDEGLLLVENAGEMLYRLEAR